MTFCPSFSLLKWLLFDQRGSMITHIIPFIAVLTCSVVLFPIILTYDGPSLPYLDVDGTRVNTLEPTISVRENKVVAIRCTVNGASPSVKMMFWMLGEENITSSAQLMMDYSAIDDKYSTQSVLHLNITKDLAGKMITCYANHPGWTSPAVTSGSIEVLYEPSFSISRDPGFGFPIVEGMTVTLKCEIDAHPWSQPYWIKDTSKSNVSLDQLEAPPLRTDEEGSFTIIAAKASHTGWYRCVTDHPLGHFASFGYFLNIRSEMPNMHPIPGNSPLSPLTSELNSIIGREDHRPSSASRSGTFSASAASSSSSASVGSSSISVTSSETDEGHVGEMATGTRFMSNGESVTRDEYDRRYHLLERFYDEKQRTLCGGDKTGLPLIVSINRTVIALVGRPISLSAEFCCNPRPRKVFWVHRHLAMAPGRIIGPYFTKDLVAADHSQSCFTSTFDIDSVKAEDSGVISFIVANSKGLDDVEIQLNVTRVGFSVSKGHSHHIPHPSHTYILFLACWFSLSHLFP